MSKKKRYLGIGAVLLLLLAGFLLWQTRETPGEIIDPTGQVSLLQEALTVLDRDMEDATEQADQFAIRTQRAAMEKEIELLKQGVPEEYTAKNHPSRKLSQWGKDYEAWGYSSEYAGRKYYHIILQNAEDTGRFPLTFFRLHNKKISQAAVTEARVYPLLRYKKKGTAMELQDSPFACVPFAPLQKIQYGTRIPSHISVSLDGAVTQRMTYRYDEDAEKWVLMLTTNKVSYILDSDAVMYIYCSMVSTHNGQERKPGHYSYSMQGVSYWEDFYRAEQTVEKSDGKPGKNRCFTYMSVWMDGLGEMAKVKIPVVKKGIR